MGGYKKMVASMMEGIEILLNEDYLDKRDEYNALDKKAVYTKAIDAFSSIN